MKSIFDTFESIFFFRYVPTYLYEMILNLYYKVEDIKRPIFLYSLWNVTFNQNLEGGGAFFQLY